MRALLKISNAVNTAAEYISAAALAAMTVVVFVQVAARIFAGSIKWSEELARYMMIYMVYLATSVGIKLHTHIEVDFLAVVLPKRGKEVLNIIAGVLTIIAGAVLLYYGGRNVSITWKQASPAMQLPMGLIYFALPLGGAMMIVQAFYNTVCAIAALSGTAEVGGDAR